MPKNRIVSVNGYEKRFVFWKRQTGSAIASVMSRFDDLLEESGPSAPISLNELTDHLREIAPDPKVRAIVGVCDQWIYRRSAKRPPRISEYGCGSG
ncbi:MAG: hypothetical protein R3E58_08365 [Phycisphaerae bacterium]